MALGINAPVTQSGHLDDAAPIEIEGPAAGSTWSTAPMAAGTSTWAHATPALGVADQDLVKVAFGGERGGVMDNFIVRIKPEWVPEIHLDTDEANALGLHDGDVGKLIKE
ncbi:MAG: hypothetical protein IPO80_12605 [Propionibacteriaceae bacterium]|nr:hypothetical protein [Propionibacteriaceae bacterium]